MMMNLHDAIERSISALEHRIHMTETTLIPRAKEARNYGILKVVEEGFENDKTALRVLREYQPGE